MDPNSSKIPDHFQTLDNVNEYSTETEPSYEITLIPEVSFGEENGKFLGPIIKNIAVDYKGRVFIEDFIAKTIQAYDANGSYLGSMGGEGRGPGEFQMPWGIRISENYLHALDYQLQKISIFDLDNLQHRQDIDVALNTDNPPSWFNHINQHGLFYRVTNFYIRSDDYYLIVFSDEGVDSAENIDERTYEFSIFSPKEKIYLEHDLFSFEWGGKVLVNQNLVLFDVPYKRGGHYDFSNGKLVYGWSEEMGLKVFDENGSYINAVYYPLSKIVLAKNDALIKYDSEQIKNAINTDVLPKTWPAFDDIKLDEKNRIWISTFTDDPKVYEWWVLEQAGNLLVKFNWPSDKKIEVIKDNNIYTNEFDVDSGSQRIVRYRIDLKEI
jgi:hypothetical protein